MLKGIDVSHWNFPSVLESAEFTNADFVFCKCSEGTSFVDTTYKKYLEIIHSLGKGGGLYHFAYGDKPEAEALHFFSLSKDYLTGVVVALDFEGKVLSQGPEWALRFLNKYYELSGIKPLLYASQSVINHDSYKIISDEDYPLWVANWSSSNPKCGPWKTWTVHQFTNSPYDQDKFDGDWNDWKKLGSKFSSLEPTDLKVNDIVYVKTRIDYNNVANDSWVLRSAFRVMQINGDRVVIGRNNKITGAWHKDDLIKV